MSRWIDVSSYQGAFDFAGAKKAGVEGVILRATEGHEDVDAKFSADLKAARAAGLQIGFYHFAYPNLNGAQAEAAHFIDVVGPVIKDHDIVCLDFETAPFTEAWALAWLEKVEAQFHRRPFFYSYLSAIQGAKFSAKMARYPLWLADYTSTQPAAPAPWVTIAIWQRADHDGVPGWHVDWDSKIKIPASSYRQLVSYLVATVNRKVVATVKYGGGRVSAFLISKRLRSLIKAGVKLKRVKK